MLYLHKRMDNSQVLIYKDNLFKNSYRIFHIRVF